MLWRRVRFISIFLMSMMLLSLPALVAAEGQEINTGPPAIGQPLVREGDFAVKLTAALSLGKAETEIEAENQLSEVGISPKNGWIADYPVTPDIIDELYKSVREAAVSGKISLSVEAALQKMYDVLNEAGLAIQTQYGDNRKITGPPGSQSSPSSTVINNYYQSEGPPTVTYYAPPPDYYYLYGWVPSPFWCAGFWFPGFFILHDFHRTVFIDNRFVFVSNHFNDIRHQRITRIDPVTRFNGTAIAGTGLVRTRGSIPAMGPRIERTINNAPRIQSVPNNAAIRPSPSRGAAVATIRNNNAAGLPVRNSTTVTAPVTENRSMAIRTMNNSPSRSTGFFGAFRNESSMVPTARGSRGFSMPSRGGGFDRMSSGGGNILGGRGRR